VPATILALADAVVAELNFGSFSQPLVAVRHYQPVFELSEMTELRVSVVPRGSSSKALDRSRYSFDFKIDVAIQRKVEPTMGNLDALMELVEEIGDHLRTQSLASFPEARCIEVANEPVYATEHLEEFRQFTSLLMLTYRVWR
jgi:hypothetical protein